MQLWHLIDHLRKLGGSRCVKDPRAAGNRGRRPDVLDQRLVVSQPVCDLHAFPLVVDVLLLRRSLRGLSDLLLPLIKHPVVELRSEELMLLVDVGVVAAQTESAASAIAHSKLIQTSAA